MSAPRNFSVKARLKSFVFAFRGLILLFKQEHNARIHLLAAAIVVLLGNYLALSRIEWIMVVLCIALVFAVELINSAIERTVDLVIQENEPLAGQAKDMAAGAVLVIAVGTAVTGVIIFLPKLMLLFQ